MLAVLAGWLTASGLFGDRLKTWSYEAPWHYRNEPTPREVVIVFQDEESEQRLVQPGLDKWDRRLHARLLDRLKADGSRTVVFDLKFDKASPDAAEDAAFAAALRAHGRVVLGIDYAKSGDAGGAGLGGSWTQVFPIPLFATNAAGLGLLQVKPDTDPVVRELFPGFAKAGGGQPLPTTTWRAAELEHAPVTLDPARMEDERWLNYYGPPGRIDHVSYHRALDTNQVPPGFFRDKVVLVGPQPQVGYTGAGKDTFNSPGSLGGTSYFSGVEIHATGLANLLRSEWLRRLPPAVEFLLLGVCGVLFGRGLVSLRPRLAALAAVSAAALVTAAAVLAASHRHVWFSWLIIVLVQIPIACGWAVLFQWVQAQLQNQFLEQSMSMYLSPKLVKKFARDKDRSLLLPGAQKQTLTFLFSDIAGFTSVSEGMDSDELALMMNEYFERAVGSCVHPTDGTVVKYIGDAIFAFWNAPEPQADHARRACDAALRFRAMSSTEVRGKKLVTRIGLHTGVANVGNFGSSTRVDYTAIGEDVNLAARMEGLNKYLGTTVLLTGAVRAAMGEDFSTRYLGRFQLKGFEHAAEVYELVGPTDTAGATTFFNQFDHAVQVFQKGDFAAAGEIFHRVQDALPHDGPTKFYLKHLEELRSHPLPPEWRGEVELKEK